MYFWQSNLIVISEYTQQDIKIRRINISLYSHPHESNEISVSRFHVNF